MTDTFYNQFGETLHKSSNNSTAAPSDVLSGKDYVLLYFSAHWCPPCRQFTPKLIDFYKKNHEDFNMELVFCSLDNDESDYKEYISDMPWFSMPFEAKESKVLATKYKADGIPHLVVVDGKTGEIITSDGTSELRSDAEGKKFPWKPKSFAEIWPSQVLANKDSDDKLLDSDTFKDKYLMLYFSAHWCPPCRAFTPKLSKAYTAMKKLRSDFELVFVSSDSNEGEFNEYFGEMSFCALPYDKRDEKSSLSKMFGVRGIPQLTMLGPVDSESGNRPVINSNIRSFIEQEDFDEFPFVKKNYGSAASADGINDVKSLVIFHENGDDEEQNEIKDIVKEVAGKAKEDGNELNVFWALSSDGFIPRIRSLCKMPAMSEDAAMILLDIPDDGGYYKSDVTDITVESVMKFLESPGDRLQLG